jgi:outer membrane lipoprotein-sorting protein
MRHPVACPYLSALWAMLDGEADETRRTALEAHLSSCAACRAEHRALERLPAILRERDVNASVPDEEHARLKQALLDRCTRSLWTAEGQSDGSPMMRGRRVEQRGRGRWSLLPILRRMIVSASSPRDDEPLIRLLTPAEDLRRPVRDTTLDAQASKALRQRVSAAGRQEDARPLPIVSGQRSAAEGGLQPRFHGLRLIGWRALAGIIPLGIVAGALLLLSMETPVQALQDVIRALTEARPWTTCHVNRRSRDGRIEREEWIRLPDAVRREDRQGGAIRELLVQNGSESWIYKADKKLAVHARVKVIGRLDGHEVGTVYGPLKALKQLEPEARRVGGLTISERRERRADGRAVRTVDVQIDAATHYRGDPALRGVKSLHHLLQLDAETGRLVQWRSPRTGETFEVIGYDQMLPDSLFNWQPPAGVKVAEFADWWEPRLSKAVATAHEEAWNVTVHAIDVAASGDVWLTVTGHSGSTGGDQPGWAPFGMKLVDERGRVYVEFLCMLHERPRGDAALIGFTPLHARRPGDSFPRQLTARLFLEQQHREGADSIDTELILARLPAPLPAVWNRPPTNPGDLFDPTGSGYIDDPGRRQRARRTYYEHRG